MSAETRSTEAASPLLIVLSGPSGVGKDAVLSRMKELAKPYHFTVTATTRPRRRGERDGVDYIFISEESFREMIEREELLEWANVYGNLYGVPRRQVVEALREGRDVFVKPDVQGAAAIKRLAPEGLFIFLAPPDMGELERRLSERMTESPEALTVRMETAKREMEAASSFDYVVVNRHGRLHEAVADIEAIVDRERRRSPARQLPL